MYKMNLPKRSAITSTSTVEGYTIEEKIERAKNNGEELEIEREEIYTDRKEGVMPAYNIRADKWVIATTAMEAVAKSYENRKLATLKKVEDDDEVESIDTTGDQRDQNKQNSEK